MRNLIPFLVVFSTISAFAQVKPADDGFLATVRGVDVKVEFYTPDIVRVLKTAATSNLENKKDFVVELAPQHPSVRVTSSNGIVRAVSSKLEVTMDLETGKIAFNDLQGTRLLAEKEYGAHFMPVQFVQRVRPQVPPPPPSGVTPTQSSPGQDTPGTVRPGMRTIIENTNEISQSFILDEDEVIYGLGQHQNGMMNQRGQRLVLEQNNMEIAIPYFTSVKGYGVYWDTYSITTFDDTPMGTSFKSEAGEAIDYYFLYGGDGDGTVARMRELTGAARLAPLWTFGFWQCKERYKSSDEVVEVVRKYRDLGVPLDAIVQDWKYWGEEDNTWNALSFDNPAFAGYKQMFSDLKGLNAKMMITIWPSVGEVTQIYKDLQGMDALFPMQTSPRVAKVYDIWNEEARNHFWSYMKKNMFDNGMSAWWLDGPEPEFYNTQPSDFNQPTGAGTALRNVRNTYPLFVSKGVYENQRKVTSDKRVYILTRSAFAGLQRYGAGSWSGDIRASWDVFKKQIPAGLNFSMCGIPYWNTDIGAWHPYGNVYNTANTDPGYQEFYCRWFQFATFNPMMRAHGTGSPREIYQFGERGYWAFDVQEKFLNLRYSLLPYIYSTAWRTTNEGYSFLRHMSMEAPADSNTYGLDDQFMFGQAFLVAPILEDGTGESRTVRREVYLPAGTWVDFWTGEAVSGGRRVTKAAPIDIIPVYVKAGSIVPMTTEKVQYSTEKDWSRLELRVYPGADGSFTLYEDEFDNYNYENGAYTEIPLSWNDVDRTLTIGARTGSYNGMLKSRKFVVDVPGGKPKTVTYSGRAVTVKL
jgi:Alpha-glucosidases, family 31 of glycosyl hydrolases